MREFSYITVRQLLDRLKDEGINISRTTFYNLEEDGLFASERTTGNWRRYAPHEAKLIITLIKENYGIETKESA